MKRKLLVLVVLFSVFIPISLMVWYIIHNQNNKIINFTKLPNHTLFNMNDDEYKIFENIQDQSILLVFVQSDCDYCHIEMKQISDSATFFKNTQILLISSEPIKQIKHLSEFAKNKNITLLNDKNGDFVNIFKVKHYPTLFLFDSNKKFLKQFTGLTPINKILAEQ